MPSGFRCCAELVLRCFMVASSGPDCQESLEEMSEEPHDVLSGVLGDKACDVVCEVAGLPWPAGRGRRSPAGSNLPDLKLEQAILS